MISHKIWILGLLGSSPGQVTLMLLSLGMGQVGSLVIVESQTQLTLKRSKMISHKIGILGQVDGLGSQGRQPLPPVPVGLRVGGWSSSSSLGPNSVLEIHPENLHPSSLSCRSESSNI